MRNRSPTSNSSVFVPARVGDLRRKARRTISWCALVLAFSPIPGGWLVDRCPLHIRFPEAAATLNSWKETYPPPNVLLLGSSRLGSFVRNAELTAMTREFSGKSSARFFNSTIGGGGPVTMAFLTRRLLASTSTPPNLVVIETSSDLLARDNLYFKLAIGREFTAADLPKYLGDIFAGRDAISRLVSSRIIPFYFHRSQFTTWTGETARRLFERTKSADTAGLFTALTQYNRDTRKKTLPPRIQTGWGHVQSHLRHYQLAGATAADFESTVAMLHARGCMVVLLQPPLTSQQRAFFTPGMRGQFDAFVQRLRDSYACYFVDYSERLPDTFFEDGQHANSDGSLRFTELLAREVVAPAWRNLNQPAD